jgi:arylsulfatase A-like enzyme
MGRLLRPSPGEDELDRGVTTMDYRLCGTLAQLESRLAAITPATPVFAYSLPQDVHMSRLPATVESGPEFRGFHAPYATKVHAIDACFGRFVDALKARGLYDRSLIVLTSDHGEMLGEDGRFGHSTHLFPQVVRVPLLVHLPSDLARRAAIDPDTVALSTDITPTIYSALGYTPAAANPLMGRSLVEFDARAVDTRRHEPVVIASSYGPVYAVLQDNGERLYIADALSGLDLSYVRDAAGRWTAVEVSAAARTVNQFLIRQHIDEVSRVFHVNDAAAHHGEH